MQRSPWLLYYLPMEEKGVPVIRHRETYSCFNALPQPSFVSLASLLASPRCSFPFMRPAYSGQCCEIRGGKSSLQAQCSLL